MLYCLLPKYRHLSPFICKTRETLLLFTTKGVILKERGEEEKKEGEYYVNSETNIRIWGLGLVGVGGSSEIAM
jgi:hypothetical protein